MAAFILRRLPAGPSASLSHEWNILQIKTNDSFAVWNNLVNYLSVRTVRQSDSGSEQLFSIVKGF